MASQGYLTVTEKTTVAPKQARYDSGQENCTLGRNQELIQAPAGRHLAPISCGEKEIQTM